MRRNSREGTLPVNAPPSTSYLCVRVCLQACVLAFMRKKYAHPQGQEKAKERSFGATIAMCSISFY